MLPAFFALGYLNLSLQSLPLVLVMSLLRHPVVAQYAKPRRRHRLPHQPPL